MYEVSVRLSFSAAHRLCDYPGDCERLHGHNWRVVVVVRARELDELGMVCDFRLVKRLARELVEEFDHTLINDHPAFTKEDPSSERLARYFFERLQSALDAGNHWLHAVEMWETENSAARYIRDEEPEAAPEGGRG
jgi:6-pyruvoyltetrahydropterin/6-carboxytetrahydropterin synthase